MQNNLPITKVDLDKAVAKLATKNELKAAVSKLATKEELKKEVAKLATKDELKDGLAKLAATNKEDLQKTERAIRAGLQIDLEEFRQEINEKLGLMPTKDEFFSRIDKVMGELQTTRDQQVLLSAKSSDHEDRIVILEQSAGLAAV